MSKFTTGSDFLPYHPSASHVSPEYRDGWNACYEAAQTRIAELERELETERMRVVACGVVALQNTEGSKAERIGKDNPYWSASYGDVCRAVDAEIELCAKVAELERDAAKWIPVSEGLPEIPTNCTREFIVACRRPHDGKTYIFAAEYLQELLLQSTYPDDDEPEDGKPYTGWYQERNCESGDFDTEWQNIEADGSVITHWMPLPKAPAAIQGEKQ